MLKAFHPLLFVGLAMVATSGSGREDGRFAPLPVAIATDGAPDDALSIMTYNIKGLPWPLALGRDEAIGRIGDRLAALRRAKRQPHIVMVQEAFSARSRTLAREGGYAHVAFGPDAALRSAVGTDAADARYLRSGRWDRGEQWGKSLGSGLMILSDYPILGIDRMAFPDCACAGLDCMANKGVLIAHVEVPGIGPVSIVDTHLNARAAAMVPVDRSQRAYARQVTLMARFVTDHVPKGRPLIVGGDMNIGRDAQRRDRFFASFAEAGLPFVTPDLAGARRALAEGAADSAARADLARTADHAKDWLFARDGDGQPMAVARALVPFGSEADGESLSDHFGYAVHYRTAAVVRKPALRFAGRMDGGR